MGKLNNIKIFFYIITFEEDSKGFKINSVKGKDNFGFRIFSYKEAILKFYKNLYQELKYGRMLLPYLQMSPERFSHILSLV